MTVLSRTPEHPPASFLWLFTHGREHVFTPHLGHVYFAAVWAHTEHIPSLDEMSFSWVSVIVPALVIRISWFSFEPEMEGASSYFRLKGDSGFECVYFLDFLPVGIDWFCFGSFEKYFRIRHSLTFMIYQKTIDIYNFLVYFTFRKPKQVISIKFTYKWVWCKW